MKTDLRLLLDECLQAELAKEIKKWGALDTQWVNETKMLLSASDDELMDVARADNRILVTIENRINEKKYRLCTHPGIIVFKAKAQHDVVKAKLFKRFMLSGQRARARKAVTYLKMDSVTFKEMGKDGKTVETMTRWEGISVCPVAQTNYCGSPNK